ncbi:MAG: tyrosine-type recombinase/integrase [Chloroflexi bacterium]|nr:tyrosine-type recombinase/integrase [Chloroflexota bacterium]
MLIDQVVDEYLVAIDQAGKSTATLRQYGWHLKKMSVWLTEQSVNELEQVDKKMLREWGAGLRDKWGSATRKQAVCAARSFFGWCWEEELIGLDPGQFLKVPKVKKRIQRTLIAKEIQMLLEACGTNLFGLRNAAIVSLLTDSGLRAEELCELCIQNLNLQEGILTVISKGGDEDYACFSDTTARRLEAWLKVRLANPSVDKVFVSIGGTTPGEKLTPRGLRIIVRKLGQRAGVEGVSPHTFRRAFACLATEAGALGRILKDMGRWCYALN